MASGSYQPQRYGWLRQRQEVPFSGGLRLIPIAMPRQRVCPISILDAPVEPVGSPSRSKKGGLVSLSANNAFPRRAERRSRPVISRRVKIRIEQKTASTDILTMWRYLLLAANFPAFSTMALRIMRSNTKS
ncbi:hypothetical protein CISG_05083 [Coccidioides immitis RMSCC 3703]|uniref:Uncharacterized protein n=1 Tax=Coccidioides immitis RMSCC 3703 TaxID=454286 RepID=A0A0J8QVU3_COCIT|nr:hypothetical protein CISG_05083 [Coccidioides immitis RMSCC 3703]